MYKDLLNTSVKSWVAPDSRVHNLRTHAALFLQLVLRSRVIGHENGAFRKRFSNMGNLKTPALSFREDGKYFKRNVISLAEISSSKI